MLDVNTAPESFFARQGSYPVRAGNAVSPLIDGEPAFERICQAVEAAERSVWVTVAFINPEFRMPGNRGSLFDVLKAAAARGVDVRALFWRNNEGSGFADSSIFSGTDAHHRALDELAGRFHVRWDRADRRYCQHQKSWLIDAGFESEIAFVGGINLGPAVAAAPGHAAEPQPTHDIYVELQGPSASDVHHNFVQRWNEASERNQADGFWPPEGSAGELDFPTAASAERGDVLVQVQRTVRANLYSDSTAAPGAGPFEISGGEQSCFEQYERAIAAAKGFIYIENQALGQPETVEALHQALERGVVVTVLVPADAEGQMAAARKDPRAKSFFDRLGALGKHPHFLLAGIARRTASGAQENIYVHAKAAVIDDLWATIGSCNIGARSFFGDTELNVSFVSEREAGNFREALFREHLGSSPASPEGVEASLAFQRAARTNADRFRAGEPMMGLVYALDPETYGTRASEEDAKTFSSQA